MLTAYFDDSGTHGKSEIVLWSGVFGNQQQWARFNKEWSAVLKEPCPKWGPLKRFHMTECQSSRGEFTGWTRNETDYLVWSLIDIIVQCGLYANGLAVARKHWDAAITGDAVRAFGDAEGYCLRICYVRSLNWARKYTDDVHISYLFDRRPERHFENQRIFDVFKRYSEIELQPPHLETIEFVSSYDHLPLQAADLIAWEMYQQAILNLKEGRYQRRPNRRQLSKLIKGGRINTGIASPDVIRKVAVRLRNVDPDKIIAVADHMTV